MISKMWDFVGIPKVRETIQCGLDPVIGGVERKSVVEHDTRAGLHLVFDRKSHLVRYNDLRSDPAPAFGENLRGYPGGHHQVRSRVGVRIQASDRLLQITGHP